MSFFSLQPYQFIIAALALVMIAFGLQRYLKGGKGQTVLKLLVRLVVWGGMLAITIFPRLTYSLARAAGIEGDINAVTLTGFLLIFLILFKLLSVIERIEYQITLLTRQDALKNINHLKRDK